MPELFAPVCSPEEAAAWRERQREAGRTVVFTNGCFDLLHAGHVAYLAWAREQGDALVVGLNGDDSVRALKGAQRPFVRFEERARVLSALRSIDLIVGFSERTPEAIIERLRPDVHVKSSQYGIDDLPEREAVLAGGGRIALAPHEAGLSTTDLAALIKFGAG
jgi:rfaE bifunctional protein nucleotidyltransferase chain/domain